MKDINVFVIWCLRRAVGKANCFHKKGHEADCTISNYPYMAVFGIIQIILSQIPNFHKLSFLSLMAAAMSFTYATIGIGLAIATVAGTYNSFKIELVAKLQLLTILVKQIVFSK